MDFDEMTQPTNNNHLRKVINQNNSINNFQRSNTQGKYPKTLIMKN